jgi:hypothetical protein
MILAREAIRGFWADWESEEVPEYVSSSTLEELRNWNETTAPGGLWHNYVDRTENYGEAGERLAIMPNLGLHELLPQHTTLREGQVIHVPRRRHETAPYALTDEGAHDPLPGGLDCVAFAVRAQGWDGNRYQVIANGVRPGITEGGGFEPGYIGQRYPLDVSTAEEIEREATSDLIVSWEVADDSGNLVSRIVPGDMLFYGTSLDENDLAHLAIVQSVEYDEEGFVNISSIRLIESTQGFNGLVQSVINERSVGFNPERDNYDDRSWRIVRLRHVE